MAKLFHAGVLLLALVLSSASPLTRGGNLYEKVRPSLRRVLIDKGEMWGICTATSIAPQRYLTAAHCFEGSQGSVLEYPDVELTLQKVDKKADLALLVTEEARWSPPLELAPRVDFGEEVVSVGYSMGSNPPFPVTFFGKIMGGNFNRRADLLWVDASGNVGSSGGAIVNQEGKLVGIIQGGVNPPSTATYGATLKTIKEFLR